ncbi:carbohydrate ABC transporter permease [Rubrivivax sp. RP6-9]|uniref:carbohydrate ABC transporter permease n=1 Tax=Rubrivivax sp. RP6-9 TaxID=3415750 RepID=UPI003CC51469
MAWADRLRHSAALGLAAGVALVLALSAWLQGSADADIAAQQKQRQAVLLANAVSASLAGVPEDGVNARLRTWTDGLPALQSVQVVAGRQLLGSTRAEDQAPRALQREEKPLFDLAGALRAAGETNTGEGVVRKKTLQIEDKPGQPVTVTVPYVADGQFAGIVQARVLPAAAAHRSAGGSLALGAGLVALAFAIGVFLKVDTSRRFDIGRGIAVAVLLALALAVQQQRLGAMGQVLADSDAAMARVQAEAAAVYVRTGAPPVTATTSAWDTDTYSRPLGLLSADGRVLPHAAAAKATRTVFLERSLWAANVLGLLLLLYFVQGWAGRTARALRTHADAYAYIAPAMIGMLVLVFFPFFYGIGLAFTDTTLFNESLPFRERWIGLDNFVRILGDFDIVTTGTDGSTVNYQNFYWTLMMTVIWTVTNVTVGVSFGFILALALNTDGLKGKWLYRILLILPWAIPNYITALVWRGMFHPQFGVINQALQMFGIAPVAWFDSVVSSFVTGLVTNGWLSFPFMMVVILGALQSIPKDMYEAAEVEGATRWQQLRRITLPLLRPTLVPAVVLSVVWTFNMFNIIFLVSGGEPGGANEILVTKAYKLAFEQYQYAYAAAYSTVIFIILLVYGYFQTRMTRATESY